MILLRCEHRDDSTPSIAADAFERVRSSTDRAERLLFARSAPRMRLFAHEAFLPGGWAPDVAIEIAPDGAILQVETAAAPGNGELVDGPVLPGMPNAHSHAFQRAMAGRAERRAAAGDNFWTWR